MIATERLLLRRWRADDRAPFAAMGQDPEVMRYFPGLLDRAASDALIDRFEAHFAARGYGLWVIERRSDGTFLGFTGLADVDFPSPIAQDVEIGWRLARAGWGKGYATEAAAAALDFAWTRLAVARVVSMAVAANTRSLAVMQRLGLHRRADLDFDHPRLAPGHWLRRHIVHAVERA